MGDKGPSSEPVGAKQPESVPPTARKDPESVPGLIYRIVELILGHPRSRLLIGLVVALGATSALVVASCGAPCFGSMKEEPCTCDDGAKGTRKCESLFWSSCLKPAAAGPLPEPPQVPTNGPVQPATTTTPEPTTSPPTKPKCKRTRTEAKPPAELPRWRVHAALAHVGQRSSTATCHIRATEEVAVVCRTQSDRQYAVCVSGRDNEHVGETCAGYVSQDAFVLNGLLTSSVDRLPQCDVECAAASLPCEP